MATQQERRQATRANLIDTARNLLRNEGIEGTTTRRLLDEAKISRGALYHHFDSLEDLIAAVYEQESKGAIERALRNRTSAESPFDDLVATSLAWLNELADQDVAKILVVEGPAAIGGERCRRIEAKHSLAQMKNWLREAADRGEIDIASEELVARMLNAVLSEAALSIVKSNGADLARRDAEKTFRQFVAGLRSLSK